MKHHLLVLTAVLVVLCLSACTTTEISSSSSSVLEESSVVVFSSSDTSTDSSIISSGISQSTSPSAPRTSKKNQATKAEFVNFLGDQNIYTSSAFLINPADGKLYHVEAGDKIGNFTVSEAYTWFSLKRGIEKEPTEIVFGDYEVVNATVLFQREIELSGMLSVTDSGYEAEFPDNLQTDLYLDEASNKLITKMALTPYDLDNPFHINQFSNPPVSIPPDLYELSSLDKSYPAKLKLDGYFISCIGGGYSKGAHYNQIESVEFLSE